MQHNQTHPQDDFTREGLHPNRTATDPDRQGEWSVRPAGEDAEGQLGPDELPDPNEVMMNLQAKRHQ